MDRYERSRDELLFESYNAAVQKAYERLIDSGEGYEMAEDGEGILQELISAEAAIWERSSVESLEGRSPIEYIDGINGIEEAIRLFGIACGVCDGDLPELLLKKLKSYGEDAVDRLLTLSSGYDEEAGAGNRLFIALMSIRAIGCWKVERAVKTLIGLLWQYKEKDEIVNEEIADALVNIGGASIPGLLKELECGDINDCRSGYILDALVRAGKHCKSDDIFICLKRCFMHMDDRLLGAAYLADYGDGRAVSFLRGYIEKNRQSLSEEVFCEIISSIKRLGGNTDDLM